MFRIFSGIEWSHWEHIGSPDTDDTTVIPNRFLAAGKVVKNAMDQCLKFSSGSVSMVDTLTIRSRQIMDGNTYFNSSFLLAYLASNAAANKANDGTYETWKNSLIANTYDPSL